MSAREQDDSGDNHWQVSPRNRDGTRRRTGTFVGPLRITPTRVTLAVALIGTGAFLLYALAVRDTTQIPMLSAGAGVLGIVFSALAVAGAVSTYRAARDGRGGRAFGMAILGGVGALIAFGCFAAASILAILARP